MAREEERTWRTEQLYYKQREERKGIIKIQNENQEIKDDKEPE